MTLKKFWILLLIAQVLLGFDQTVSVSGRVAHQPEVFRLLEHLGKAGTKAETNLSWTQLNNTLFGSKGIEHFNRVRRPALGYRAKLAQGPRFQGSQDPTNMSSDN